MTLFFIIRKRLSILFGMSFCSLDTLQEEHKASSTFTDSASWFKPLLSNAHSEVTIFDILRVIFCCLDMWSMYCVIDESISWKKKSTCWGLRISTWRCVPRVSNNGLSSSVCHTFHRGQRWKHWESHSCTFIKHLKSTLFFEIYCSVSFWHRDFCSV